jgi:hypothetical protein
MHICSHMRLFLPYVLYTVWCLSKSYEHTNNCKEKQLVGKKKKEARKRKDRKKQQHRLGTNVRVRGFKERLLVRSQFAPGSSCDRPTLSRFSVVLLGPRVNAELVLHASHSAIPMGTLKISTYTKVTLTFDVDFGLDQPVHGGYG